MWVEGQKLQKRFLAKKELTFLGALESLASEADLPRLTFQGALKALASEAADQLMREVQQSKSAGGQRKSAVHQDSYDNGSECWTCCFWYAMCRACQ